MTDEEKKAIERLKNFGDSISCATYPPEAYIEMKEDIEDILYLIEKQQKEIEELKTDRDKFKKALGKRIIYCNELEKDLFENCNKYVVSKDKIKAKIVQLDDEKRQWIEDRDNKHKDSEIIYAIEVLQSLLEKE